MNDDRSIEVFYSLTKAAQGRFLTLEPPKNTIIQLYLLRVYFFFKYYNIFKINNKKILPITLF